LKQIQRDFRLLAAAQPCDNPDMRTAWFPALLILALTAAGCGVTTPENNVTENLTGTIAPGGNSDKNFTVSQRGEVSLTFRSITPSVNGSLLVGLGQPAGTTCGLFQNYIQAITVNRPLDFGLLDQGPYCITAFDPGILTVATTYTATLSHP
jgi:hypothetical protein